MKTMLGEDLGNLDAADELNSPGGIITETLLNSRTVAALSLEQRRYIEYEKTLLTSEPNYRFDAFTSGVTGGLSVFLQQWISKSWHVGFGVHIRCLWWLTSGLSVHRCFAVLVWWLSTSHIS